MSRRATNTSARSGRDRTRHPGRDRSTASAITLSATTQRTGQPPGSSHSPSEASKERVEPEALVATSWFDSGEGAEPYTATVRFTGHRLGVTGQPGKADAFTQDEVIEGIVPGTGPVAITTWVYSLNSGEWTVNAELLRASGDRRPAWLPGRSRDSTPVHPARWSWLRWRVESAPAAPLKTRWALIAPLARIPAVMPGIYTALAVVGAVVALALQSTILTGEGVAAGSSLAVSIVAIVAGLIGAKAWYKVLHPTEPVIKAGWAVDGFLVVAPLAGVVGLLAANLPIGRVVDATTPGLFFAVAVGRIGCFFTGCCAGRPTNARWAIWSSDRRVGTRRVPVQLVESAAGWILGIATLPLAAGHVLPVHGAVFVIAFGGYAIVRQAILRIRAEQRAWSSSLPLTAAAAVAVLVLVTVVSALQIAGTPAFA